MLVIYHKDFIPEALLARHPKPAHYVSDVLFAFCESLEVVTGTPAKNTINIADMDITMPQLQGLVSQLMAAEPTGQEVQLNDTQARWLYYNDDRFKPQQTEESI